MGILGIRWLGMEISKTHLIWPFLSSSRVSQERDGTTQLPVSLYGRIDEKPQRSLLPAFESAEVRTLAESLSRNIIRGNPDVKWESIKGLENAKHLLKEAVVMPIKYPKFIKSGNASWIVLLKLLRII
ncbi:uncharacterized protein LOC131238976 [Magnolia sinica]|uniref:uncharacterized protein LOC131238976 n=1 Tax=Magnolia sinica TaxID=86752 RepID=UPI002659D6AD|nr:uncharacterized protein LOC131238976 [Magnolia sinica]